jgi:hypothetical protein
MAGISEADWHAAPSAVRALILAQQEEIQQLRAQVWAMATELASLRERIGRTSAILPSYSPAMVLGLSRQSDAMAVAASAGGSQAIPCMVTVQGVAPLWPSSPLTAPSRPL